MKIMKFLRSGIPILFLLLSIAGKSQDLSKILVKALSQKGEKEMSRLDSVDFQFAISFYEGTGFLDVSNRGEAAANLMYAARTKKEKSKADFARDTLNAAIQLYSLRLYSLSYHGYVAARRYMEKHGLTNQVNYIRCISGLALVSLIRGKTFESDQLLDNAMKLSEEKLGKTSVAYAANLNSRAKWNQLNGNYNDAEAQFRLSAKLVEKKFGTASLQYAILLNNQAMLGLVMGRTDQAIEQMIKSVQIAEQVFDEPFKGKNSFENRIFLSNLAWVYLHLGRIEDAEKTYLRIKSIFESRDQKSNPEYAALLEQLASLYMQTDKDEQAEKLLLSAADIYRRKFTEQSSGYAGAVHQLGVLNRNLSRFAEAERYGRQALETRFKALGEHHPDYIKSMEQLGITFWKQGKIQQAYNLMKNSVDRSIGFINRYFPPMSEAEKTRYWETLQPRFQRFYAFALTNQKSIPQLPSDLLNYQIIVKALLLNTTEKIKHAILTSQDQGLIKDYLNWLGRKEELARLYSISDADLSAENINIADLERQVNELEKNLSGRSAQFSETFASQQFTINEISSKLLPEEALVEVIRVRSDEKKLTENIQYVFLVLSKDEIRPRMVSVSNGLALETRMARYYKNSILTRQPDDLSYDNFWHKIDSMLVGKKLIFFSPDGVYNQINLNTIRKPGGNYMLNQYSIVSMGNPKDVLSIKKSKNLVAEKTAFLMGDPAFGGTAPALPGTKTEIDNIQKVLKTKGYQVNIKTQQSATESNLKSVRSPGILHLATHGFFEPDRDLRTVNGETLGAEEVNPLLQSGLLLTPTENIKVKNQKIGYEISDNGLLTAYEAMSLNLDRTQLVVLSACETGLGEVRAGEGVYGLQRAFLAAGAQAIIMSLWKVDDLTTQELMSNFYNALDKSPDKLQAFRVAQSKLMTKYPEPYYWGGFIFVSN